jgi:hypothetical protein
MTSELISFRPLKENLVIFWRLRRWCFENGFSFSDIINSILEPLLYHLENASERIPGTNMVNVNLCPGTVTLTPSQKKRHPTPAEREYFAVMGKQITDHLNAGHKLPEDLAHLL